MAEAVICISDSDDDGTPPRPQPPAPNLRTQPVARTNSHRAPTKIIAFQNEYEYGSPEAQRRGMC